MSSLIELVKIGDGLRVSSRLMAERTGTSYKATNNLIRKHRKPLETFGELTFKKDDKSKSGREKPALLNEDQAIFLLTLSRNTEVVVEFKRQLVNSFSKFRRVQARIDENHAKSEWQQNRQLGKYQRHNITDVIQKFVDYAKSQGSHSAGYYFSNITKVINKVAGVDSRDKSDERQLHLIATTELIVEHRLLAGMSEFLPYKLIYADITKNLNVFAGIAGLKRS